MNVLIKARSGEEKAGHRYYKREPKAGGGYKYYYTKEQYLKEKGGEKKITKKDGSAPHEVLAQHIEISEARGDTISSQGEFINSQYETRPSIDKLNTQKKLLDNQSLQLRKEIELLKGMTSGYKEAGNNEGQMLVKMHLKTLNRQRDDVMMQSINVEKQMLMSDERVKEKEEKEKVEKEEAKKKESEKKVAEKEREKLKKELRKEIMKEMKERGKEKTPGKNENNNRQRTDKVAT